MEDDLFGFVSDDDEETSFYDSGTTSKKDKTSTKRRVATGEPFSCNISDGDMNDLNIDIIRLPEVVGIEFEPYDSLRDEDGLISSAKQIIRWRKLPNGKRQSNTRIVEFMDGSMKLYIGNEAFDMKMQSLKTDVYLYNSNESVSLEQAKIKQRILVAPNIDTVESQLKLKSKIQDSIEEELKQSIKKTAKIEIKTFNEEEQKRKEKDEKRRSRSLKKRNPNLNFDSSFLEDGLGEVVDEMNRGDASVDDKRLIRAKTSHGNAKRKRKIEKEEDDEDDDDEDDDEEDDEDDISDFIVDDDEDE